MASGCLRAIVVLVTFAVLSAAALLITVFSIPPPTDKGSVGDELAVGANNGNPNMEGRDPSSVIEGGDLGTGGLVCVSLPGVSYPKTPALDRRVARFYLGAKQDLDSKNIHITLNWGFRTNCQQRNVSSGQNYKAMPGTSPHEAGRAIDVNGMPYGPAARADGLRIVNIFREHNWVWLGEGDPPHFEIKGYQVGEPNHIAWIEKIQTGFKEGAPTGGCRGTP
ncbi:MAG: hypothetical protein ACRD63_01490, partial [Pyrinomonadaceae bacterium]